MCAVASQLHTLSLFLPHWLNLDISFWLSCLLDLLGSAYLVTGFVRLSLSLPHTHEASYHRSDWDVDATPQSLTEEDSWPELPWDVHDSFDCGEGVWLRQKTKDVTHSGIRLCIYTSPLSNLTQRRTHHAHTEIIRSVSHTETSSALKALSQSQAY